MGIKAIIQRIPAKIGSFRRAENNSSKDDLPSHHGAEQSGEQSSASGSRRMLRSASFALSYVKRLAKKTKSVLDCVLSVETLGSNDMAQSEYVERESKPSLDDSLESVRLEEGKAGVNSSVSHTAIESSQDESPGKGQEEQDPIAHLMSDEDSDEGITAVHDDVRHRFYHQLPCEEKQPTIQQGMVKRLATLLLPLFTGGLSNEEYLEIISKTKPRDVDEESSRHVEEGDGKQDHSASQVSLTTVCPTDIGDTSHQEMKTGGSCELNVNQEELKLTEQAVNEVSQKGLQTSLKSEHQEVKSSKKKVSFKLPKIDDRRTSKSSDDGKASDKDAPSLECAKERIELEPTEVVPMDRMGLTPNSSDATEDSENNAISRQASFAYSEDYCTPILEFEMKQFGCVLQ